jgi:hypothetical protein
MEEMMYRINIVAVDFDDTLNFGEVDDDINKCTYFFNRKAIEILKEFQARGGIVILWTCRTGEHLDEAVALLEKLADFKPDHINEDCPEIADRYAHKEPVVKYPQGRKVYADLYIDDRSTVWRSINWDEVREWLNQKVSV